MSLIGAFNNGVSGLFASAEALGTVSQNIANIRTPGYRRVETGFETLLGGIDVRGQEPGGVRTVTQRFVDVQGTIEPSNRQFDMAINGRGFFIFSTDPNGGTDQVRYSRAGNLTTVPLPSEGDVGYLANQQGLLLLGWKASENGQFSYGDMNSLVPIPATSEESFAGTATATASLRAILPADDTRAGTQAQYFDANGDSHTLTLNWTKTAPNTWSLQVSDSAGAPVGTPATMTFDGDGNLTSSSTINIGGLFDLDVSGVTQRGSVFVLGDYQQDGIARGEFVKYQVSDDGTIFGFYSSGAVRPLYRIPIATFVSANDLAEEPGNLYRQTAKSGKPSLEKAGTADLQIVPNSLELANFDLSDGFTRLIVTQRAYDTAAQVVKTVDEMNQIVRDMKR